MSRLLEVLDSDRVLLMDGAMGTELQRAGIGEGECYELWNLTHRDRVRAIHQAYVDAGAEVLLTNTFQANPAALARHGLLDRGQAIWDAALSLAHSAAGPEPFVLADIGPLGSEVGMREAWRLWEALKEWIASSAAEVLLLETASDVLDLITLRKMMAVRKMFGLLGVEEFPILLSFTYRRAADGSIRNIHNWWPEACIRKAKPYGIAALGVNCGRDIGMDEVIEIVRRYRGMTDLPLFARPTAGTPTRVGDRWVYPHTPEAMAARLPELLEAGVCMVGGCCGTTPAHIAAFRPILDAWNARHGGTAQPTAS
jgi:5-methyltetrahydrofolate--homocysteine methyltransferase